MQPIDSTEDPGPTTRTPCSPSDTSEVDRFRLIAADGIKRGTGIALASIADETMGRSRGGLFGAREAIVGPIAALTPRSRGSKSVFDSTRRDRFRLFDADLSSSSGRELRIRAGAEVPGRGLRLEGNRFSRWGDLERGVVTGVVVGRTCRSVISVISVPSGARDLAISLDDSAASEPTFEMRLAASSPSVSFLYNCRRNFGQACANRSSCFLTKVVIFLSYYRISSSERLKHLLFFDSELQISPAQRQSDPA